MELPTRLPGAEWQLDASFNAADEILRDPDLVIVYKAALEKGPSLSSAEGQLHRRPDLLNFQSAIIPLVVKISLARSLGFAEHYRLGRARVEGEGEVDACDWQLPQTN
jgi:hypothetical protein